ncbi:MAG: DUF2807 domain-containing protein [Cyclobacteriaceae bacterium]|nr:DUF2807 domain-containing protein [Cyclobacteriaceae bacterium]
MRRELSLYFLLMLMITTLSYNQFVSRNQQTTQTLSINLQNNQLLEIAISGKVFITEGDGQSVVLEGPEKLIKSIKVMKGKEKLSISYASINPLTGLRLPGESDKLHIYINIQNLDLLSFKAEAEIISSDYFLISEKEPEKLAQTENDTFFNSTSDIVFFDLNKIVSAITEKVFHHFLHWIIPPQLNSCTDPVIKSACCNWV